MNEIEIGRERLIARIIDGLEQKPAYLMFFGVCCTLFVFGGVGLGYGVWWSERPYAHEALLAGFGLGALALIGAVIVVIVVTIAESRRQIPIRQRQVMEQLLALGTSEDIPLTENMKKRWAKRWNCRWTYLAKSGSLKPYVDDNVSFFLDRINTETGLAKGVGESPYRGGTRYDIFGRISKRNMALMFYKFREELEPLMGVVILRMKTGGDVHGWWLGIGKENMDVGGRFTWTDSSRDADFRSHAYDVSEDPPKR